MPDRAPPFDVNDAPPEVRRALDRICTNILHYHDIFPDPRSDL